MTLQRTEEPARPIYVTVANGRSIEMHMIGLVHYSRRELTYYGTVGSAVRETARFMMNDIPTLMERGRNCTTPVEEG